MSADGAEIAGAWLVDKPAGPTSHDVVASIRRALPRGTKVGHAGTLDPFATGLLVVLTGRATRLVPYLVGLDKRYEATVRLGARSDSGDPEGPIHEGGPPPSRVAVETAVRAMVGRIRQRVPALAAVKVDGEPLYRRARRGEAVERPEREVDIHALAVAGYDRESGRLGLDVHCGSGTYVRQIAVDLGEALGCGGYCLSLRRTAVGPHSVDAAVSPEAVDAGPGIGMAEALAFMETRWVDEVETGLARDGRPVPDRPGAPAGRPVALVTARRLVAVAMSAPDATLRPKTVVAPQRAVTAAGRRGGA